MYKDIGFGVLAKKSPITYKKTAPKQSSLEELRDKEKKTNRMKNFYKMTMLFITLLWTSTILMAQNMNRYITLTVTNGALIKLNLAADADNTPVKIVSGNNTYNITVGTDWTGPQVYTADATTMTVYGNIKQFNCFNNGQNITGLDPTKNTALTDLRCAGNSISNLNVSKNSALTILACYSNQLKNLDVTNNTALTELTCFFNQIMSLDVSKNLALTVFFCYNNQLNSLDISNNTALRKLICSHNQLSSLDVSNNIALQDLCCGFNQLSNLDVNYNTALKNLYCESNQLNNLDISHNTALQELICHLNPFSTQAIDNIYCALADRIGARKGVVYTLNNASDTNYTNVLASNAQNARDKNWKVWFYDDYSGALHDINIPTTGTYTCSNNISITNVSVTPSSINLQIGTNQQLTATVLPTNASNKNVTWSSSNNGIATVDNTGKVTAIAAGTANITVKTVDGGKTAVCVVTVTDNTPPATPTITVVNHCGYSVLTAGNYTGELLWSTGATTKSITVTTSGIYTLIQKVNGVSSNQASANVTIWQTPGKPTITVEVDTLTATAASKYYWFLDDSPITDNNMQKLVIDKNGNYSVQVENDKGCKSEVSDKIYVVYSSVADQEVRIVVYPNPVTDQLTVEGLPTAGNLKLKLYNVTGQLIVHKQCHNSIEKIDMSDKVSGIYLLKIVDNNVSRSIKIIKP